MIARNGVYTKIDEIQERVSHIDLANALEPLSDQAQAASQWTKKGVREHPLPFLLTAVAVGLFLGYMIKWRR